MSLLFVILLVGGILSYIFREQVTNTIQAEMIADIRNYNPDDPENTVTKAWDETQQQLSCCGLMTEQVS
jgi:tetraspanin-11